MKSVLTVVSIVVLFAACSTPTMLPKDLTEQHRALLPFRIDSVVFVDNRSDTLTTEMKLPLIAARQREWKISPVLTSDLREELKKIIASTSNSDGLATSLTVLVEEGYYKISGNAAEVGEHALFNCTLRFDVTNFPGDFKTFASANYDYVGIFNATEKHAKQIYRITARNGVFTALKNAEKAFDQ